MLRALLTVALTLALSAGARAAQPGCTRGNAQAVTVLRMLEHPKHFDGRCIRLKGIAAFRTFYDDLPSLYARLTRRSGDPEPHYVALYSGDGALLDRLWQARESMEIVGRASTCETMGRRAQEDAERENAEAEKAGSNRVVVVMMSGPCHYEDGPIIQVSQAVSLPGKARLTGEAARARYGDAFFLPLPRDSVRKPVEALIAALRNRDAAALSARKIEDDWKVSTAAELLDPAKSPFAFLLGATRDPQTAYFDLRLQMDDVQPGTIGMACICRKDDCTGDWPIAFADMDSGDGIAKCLWIYDDGHVGGI